MGDCCNYFIVEVKNQQKWVPIQIQSKDIKELTTQLAQWFAQNGRKEYRIVQRSIEKDRLAKLRTPKCC